MRFDYLEPKTIEETLSLLSNYKGKAKVIAGGTDIMLQVKNKSIIPEYLIDITNIPRFEYINYSDKFGLRIGSLTTIRSIETSPELKTRFPIISQAASQLGSVAIRNVATIGGNLCNALPSAEMAQVMMALSAKMKVIGPKGKREIPVEEFFIGPGKTVMMPDELLLEIKVPKVAPNTKGIYIKHTPRGTIDLAIVNITVLLTLDEDQKICTDARIVLGAVAPTPLRAKKVEKVLKKKRLDDELISEAAKIASEEAHPRPDSIRGSVNYKKEMVKVLLGRAIRQIVSN